MEPQLIKQLALGIVPPLLVALVLFPAFWWRRRATRQELPALTPPTLDNTRADPTWLAPLVFGLIGVVMSPIIASKLPFPPTGGADWLAFVALAGLVMGLTAKAIRFPIVVRWLVRLAVIAAVGYVSLRAPIHGRWSPQTSALWLAGFTAITGVVFWAAERHTDRTRGPAGPIVLLVLCFAANQLLILGYHSLKLAQYPGFFAAALGPVLILALIRPRFTLAFGGVHVPVLMTAAALLQGTFAAVVNDDAPFPFVWVLMLAASPILALVGSVGPLGRLTGWKAAAVRGGLAALPAFAAVGWAASTYEFPTSDY